MRLLNGKEFVFDINFSFDLLLFPALVAAFFTHYLTNFFIEKSKIQEDASIGITFTFIVSLTSRNSHLGVEAIMGNIDAISYQDCKTAFFVFLLSLVWILFCRPIYTLLSFDRGLAKVLGIKVGLSDASLMFLCSLVLITGFKSVGVVMILALMTFPILSAMFFVQSIPKIKLRGSNNEWTSEHTSLYKDCLEEIHYYYDCVLFC
jgi:manganese/zinc/iron transport system permease protein